MSIADKFETIADAVYDKGVSDGENNVWSAIVFPNRDNYQYAFARWGKHMDFSILEGIKYKVTFWMFGYNSTIEELDIDFDLSSATSINNMFYGCSNLKKIKKINFGNSISKRSMDVMFSGANALEEVTIEGAIDNIISFKDCIKLNRASIESIVKHLSTTQGATLTLSAEAVNREFSGEEWETFIAEYKPSTWSIALK